MTNLNKDFLCVIAQEARRTRVLEQKEILYSVLMDAAADCKFKERITVPFWMQEEIKAWLLSLNLKVSMETALNRTSYTATVSWFEWQKDW